MATPHLALPILLILAACAPADPGTQERLACLGEAPSAACQSVFARDLGVVPAGGPVFGAPLAGPPRTSAASVPGPAVCSMGGQGVPLGGTMVRERTGDVRGVGLLRPNPSYRPAGALPADRRPVIGAPVGRQPGAYRPGVYQPGAYRPGVYRPGARPPGGGQVARERCTCLAAPGGGAVWSCR